MIFVKHLLKKFHCGKLEDILLNNIEFLSVDNTASSIEEGLLNTTALDIKPEKENSSFQSMNLKSFRSPSEVTAGGDGLVKAFVNTPAEILIKTNGRGTG